MFVRSIVQKKKKSRLKSGTVAQDLVRLLASVSDPRIYKPPLTRYVRKLGSLFLVAPEPHFSISLSFLFPCMLFPYIARQVSF
jgi:hypothetical protein